MFTVSFHSSVPYLTIGGIGFIPGIYYTCYIYMTWRGYAGYSYDQIPSYQ